MALPAPPFAPGLVPPAKAATYQMVRCDPNRYRVPRPAAFPTVTVKAGGGRIDVVRGSQVIASPPRASTQHEQVLDPPPYLPTRHRRPAALAHAHVLRRGQRPALGGALRTARERPHGPPRGGKH